MSELQLTPSGPDKRAQTKARNKLNQFRYQRSLSDDEDSLAPDLGEALALGGFGAFKLDSLKTLPEVIRPLMSRYDSAQLAELEREIEKTVPGFATHRIKLPTGLIDDIFNLYYIPPSGFTFVEATLDNGWRINLLQQLSHYYMRAMTERSPLATYIVTTELAKMLLEQLNPPSGDPPQDPGDGSKGLSGKDIHILRDAALDKAQQQLDAIDTAKKNGSLPNEGEGGKDASPTGDSLKEAKELLELFKMMSRVSISQKVLGQFVRQALSMSKAYFSDKYVEREIDLFDAEQIDDIMGQELILPQLRGIFLDELATHEKQYRTGFDIYLDRSGSMTSQAKRGENMTGIDLVKLTACILLRKGLAKDVYFFDHVVSKPHTTQVSVLKALEGGGTVTENVLKHIQKTGRPSIILTDMQDHISTYTPLAYFVGVCGATMYNSGAGKQYLNNGQMSSFDGTTLTIVRP